MTQSESQITANKRMLSDCGFPLCSKPAANAGVMYSKEF